MEVISLAAMLLALVLLVVAWTRKVPIVMALAVANFMVFVLGATTGTRGTIGGSPLLTDLAAKVAYFSPEGWPRLYTIFTATFLHADISHIVGNMLVLLMIGLPFEDRVGRARFLGVYFGSAVVAVILHSLWIVMQGSPAEVNIPLVGASGAVFGILGAFATMYPRDQIMMFFIFFVLPRVPVFLAAILLTGVEAFTLVSGFRGNVAHAAHLGGAVGGVLFGLLLKPKVRLTEARAQPRKIDYTVLERLARAPPQQALVAKLRENEDHPDTQRAWLERLLPTLTCATCGGPFTGERRGTLRCANGHEERYAG